MINILIVLILVFHVFIILLKIIVMELIQIISIKNGQIIVQMIKHNIIGILVHFNHNLT